mmetsp:Transcript_33260/g.54945  ORF Transcript_33260/g.54945 Transcript_33260/m.54945 type:complete len:397 (+) Transcript_33260:252-1442(+)
MATATSECKRLLDLHTDVLHRVLALLNCGVALAHAEASCKTFGELVTPDLWRDAVLQNWGWLLRTEKTHRWKKLFAQLHTGNGVSFCIIGSCEMPEGGFDRQSVSAAFSFSPCSARWDRLPAPSEVREMAAVVRDSTGALMVMGGTSPTVDHLGNTAFRTLSSVESFANGSWSLQAPMLAQRCCCSAAIDASGKVYVVGGGESMFRGAACMSSVECLLSPTEQWVEAPHMIQPRCALGVAISHECNRLFAFGGYSGAQNYLDSCETIDLSGGTNAQWRLLPPMTCRRAGCNAAAGPDGRIYVLGGGPDGRMQWNTMEALDPRTNEWDASIASLRCGRHYNAAAFAPDGKLYVSGAFRHPAQLDVVERYDPRADRWEDVNEIGTVVKFSGGAFIFEL